MKFPSVVDQVYHKWTCRESLDTIQILEVFVPLGDNLYERNFIEANEDKLDKFQDLYLLMYSPN